MLSEAELKGLMRKAIADPAYEPAMLRALLDAPVYVLLPMSDDSGRVRLITYTRPDGVQFIPFFSDAGRASTSAQGVVRIARVTGRELFEATPGATLMLDPNDTSMTLYPEEVAALLRGGLNLPAPIRGSSAGIEIAPAGPETADVVAFLVSALASLSGVEAIHVAQRHLGGLPEARVCIAVVAAPDALAERVARCLSVEIERTQARLDATLDLVTYDPAKGRPAWLADAAFDPVWVRTSPASRTEAS
jgi:hypothetical protein